MKGLVIVAIVVVVCVGVAGVLVAEGAFHSRGSSGSTPTYLVTFTEKALPAGTEWWVNQTGGGTWSGVGTTISWQEPDGTYDFSVATADKEYSAPGGTYTVDGTAASETIEFSLVEYTVTFTETGLQSGTEWFVNVTGGGSFSSSASTDMFSEPNGTYDYNVSAVGSTLVNSSGSFVVHGEPVGKTVRTAYTLEMTAPQAYTSPSAGVYYAFLLVSPTGGLTTGMFGLSLEASSGLQTGTLGTAVAACKWTSGGTEYTSCVAPATGTWYGVLFWQSNASTASVYTSSGWSETFPVTAAMELLVVSSANLQGSSDTLNAFSTGSSIVTGQSGPF